MGYKDDGLDDAMTGSHNTHAHTHTHTQSVVSIVVAVTCTGAEQ
jgi:hypothetical protein